MSEIKFYDYEFNPIAIETEIISLNKTVYYNKIGSFEATVSPFSNSFFEILKEPYLIAEEGGRLAVVVAKQAGEACMIFGRTPNWFLSKRIAAPFTSKRLYEAGKISAKNAEEIVRYLITKSFGSDEGNFLLGDKVNLKEELDFRRIALNALSDVVIDCLDTAGAGHELTYDKEKKRWIFNILTGKELDIVIGEAQKNTFSSEYTDSCLNYANSGIYEKSFENLGEWDASANSPTLMEYMPENYGGRYLVSKSGTQFGIDFAKGEYAAFADENGKISVTEEESGYPCAVISDTKVNGLYRWYDALGARTEETAKTELLKKKWEKTIEAETDGLKLGRDYNLGDIVRVQKKIGDKYHTAKKRIIGTEFWQENGSGGERIIFGEEVL